MGYIADCEAVPTNLHLEFRRESIVLLDVDGDNIYPYGDSVEISYEYMEKLAQLFQDEDWREAVTTGKLAKVKERGA